MIIVLFILSFVRAFYTNPIQQQTVADYLPYFTETFEAVIVEGTHIHGTILLLLLCAQPIKLFAECGFMRQAVYCYYYHTIVNGRQRIKIFLPRDF